MINTEEEQLYVSPLAKTVEISVQAIICESGEITRMIVDEDCEDYFE